MSCALGLCEGPGGSGRTIASLVVVIPGVLMAVACDSVCVSLSVFQTSDESQPQSLRLLPTNGHGAEAEVSATHSTQPHLPSNTQF